MDSLKRTRTRRSCPTYRCAINESASQVAIRLAEPNAKHHSSTERTMSVEARSPQEEMIIPLNALMRLWGEYVDSEARCRRKEVEPFDVSSFRSGRVPHPHLNISGLQTPLTTSGLHVVGLIRAALRRTYTHLVLAALARTATR